MYHEFHFLPSGIRYRTLISKQIGLDIHLSPQL